MWAWLLALAVFDFGGFGTLCALRAVCLVCFVIVLINVWFGY